MQLILYKTNDSNKVINKTLTNRLIININLKRDTNILTPEIWLVKIQGVDLKTYNYAYIPDLNRYYFINYVESVNNSIDKLTLECDVLETYRDDILNSNCTYESDVKVGDKVITSASSNTKQVVKYDSSVALEDGESIIISTMEV